jgi:hypothetical protein
MESTMVHASITGLTSVLALLLSLAARPEAQRSGAASGTPSPATVAGFRDRGVGIVVDHLNEKAFVFDTSRDRIIGVVDVPNSNFPCDVVLDRKREFAYVTTVRSTIAVFDLRGPTPVFASGTNPIPIHAIGFSLALTPDQRYLITCGPGGSNWPTSVVDVATRTEVYWANLGTHSCVEAAGDGRVFIDSQQGILAFTLDATGALVPTGTPLNHGGWDMAHAPGSDSVVLHGQNELVSFGPGLTELSSIATPFTFPSSSSIAFDADGERLYLRRSLLGNMGTLESRSYQAGVFGDPPDWVVPLTPSGTSTYGVETIAVDDVERKIFAPRPRFIEVRSMDTGALLTRIEHPELQIPAAIDVVDALGR